MVHCWLCANQAASRSLCTCTARCAAGLLSTEAGTLGRFAGNALLAGVGKLTGLQDVAQLTQFARLLHASLAAVCAALLVLLGCTHSRLRG